MIITEQDALDFFNHPDGVSVNDYLVKFGVTGNVFSILNDLRVDGRLEQVRPKKYRSVQ